MSFSETYYLVDNMDRVVKVSPNWDGFAKENDGDDVVAKYVLGRPLREFIVGDSTRMWMLALISSVRSSNKEVIRFYRCDSPTEKRFMKMTVSPEDDGSVFVSNKLLRREHMNRVHFSYNRIAELERCSICNKVQIGDAWIEPDAIRTLDIYNSVDKFEVIYSVCSDCAITC